MAPKRIIALHGKGQSGASFRRNIQPLLQRLPDDDVTVKFLDAPWELGNSGGAWWRLPPGVRSYDAKHYEGVDRSLEQLAAEWEHGDVYGLVAFSQGAILLSFFLAANMQLRLARQPALLPRKALLIGGSWPNPYTEVMESLKALPAEGLALLGCDVLTVAGERDDVNPMEMALAVSRCFGGAASVHMHPGKHIVPLDDASLDVMSRFLLSACGCEVAEPPAIEPAALAAAANAVAPAAASAATLAAPPATASAQPSQSAASQ
ncbi:hypothetical protein KFE25_000186 [Diacronema lutheri]|uniref:Serine hydrolase domain-containing protein n=1 Tax=Diacronema lutheri TaxID=2081491 RepID=A0A8J6CDY9_DIALT|nr:hypothetical protein KFE25_000186 [Diacronema lutheri]